ncbi:MAG: ATP-grasp domain-containing protein [Candidatus Omnitrophota bacterium]
MNLNIAVTSAGSAPAVAVIKALRKQRELDLGITAMDMDPDSSGNFLADRGVVIPASDRADFIDKVIKICKQYRINCLIPIIDEELFVFAKNKGQFKREGIKLIVNDPETVRLAKDKVLTGRFCARENICAPQIFTVSEIKDSDFPLIMKPKDGRGSRDVVKIKNKKELEFFKGYFTNFIIQEFIEGKEYTIDIVASGEGEILQAIPRQRITVKAGMSYKGKIYKDRRLMEYGRKIAEKFRISGPANIQCIVNKGRIYLIEVNPKFAAGLPLTVAAGVNIPLILVKLAFGIKVAKKELEFKSNLSMLRFWEEIFVSGKSSEK